MEKVIKLKDSSDIKVGLAGPAGGKTIMLPVAKESVYGQEADSLKLWGVDPESGQHFVEGLADAFQVLYFDYEGHRMKHPNPDQLTPDQIAEDLLFIADEMNVRRFSYYGYSWLALVGLQLAIRTDRLEGLIMGGFPPMDGPYKEMMVVTRSTYEQAVRNQNTPAREEWQESGNPEKVDWDQVQVKIDTNQTKQFMTLYQHLMDFVDREVSLSPDVPKLAFAGEKDMIVYGENFGGVTVDIAGILRRNQQVLEEMGWDVRILNGDEMDHTKAMHPETVLPVIKPWLLSNLLTD
ncbi:pimeloyl-ACP methyl ester carboxylesterase [Paenibacillus rhizosphaerae]|uniref:Pimeloyl-ACP methyl ester carboxylesterase n=1 Tax=Paenibacillus rhizosphaerae TaxID=297318 RepID=A0A839TJA4_9BACL|nr:alpha/beta hydrolase [Paenibacillus rhizosphaerae]MBB3126886.1 pimeloyl-ACP methyl ester carboxylesterase [Paenibacillus rhizosphaerae]